jgi:hypothetical protein
LQIVIADSAVKVPTKTRAFLWPLQFLVQLPISWGSALSGIRVSSIQEERSESIGAESVTMSGLFGSAPSSRRTSVISRLEL